MSKTNAVAGGVTVRLIEAINGFRTKYGYWPDSVDLPAETLDAIANYYLTPYGYLLVQSHLHLRAHEGEHLDILARGKGADAFSYGDEGWRTEGKHAHDARQWLGLDNDVE